MKKPNRDELLKELHDIYKQGMSFLKKAKDVLKNETFEQPYGRPYKKDEFWNKLSTRLQNKSKSLISRVIEIAPLVAESARTTPYLTQTDHIELGHAIKGMRSSLRLCRYSYWAPEVIHDEGTVLGVQPAGQSDDVGVYPDEAMGILEDCFSRIVGVAELVNPLTFERAAQTIEERGQFSTSFQPDTAFVMMWMDPKKPELEDVYNTVKRCFKEFNIEAERADDIEHEGLITEEIIDKIKSSEFLFADLTGARPSVYYEVGFAHAIRKRVILFRRIGEKLHFDLAGYNCPEYNNFSDLEAKLRRRLSHMTGRKVEKQPSPKEG